MFGRQSRLLLCITALTFGAVSLLASASGARHAHGSRTQEQAAPKILLNQPLRAVEYQLRRLTNEELVLVERRTDDPKYRPVYMAILIRNGVAPQFREEALSALVTLDKSTPARVLIEALGRVPIDDQITSERLVGLLVSQPALPSERETLVKTTEAGGPPLVLRAVYGALMVADGPDAAWKIAASREGHLTELLEGIALLPTTGRPAQIRSQLFAPISALLEDTSTDSATRIAALGALGGTSRDAAAFTLLAKAAIGAREPAERAAAIQSLRAIPEDKWPSAGTEPLVKAIIADVAALPPDGRTSPAALDLLQFGERLSSKLPNETGRDLRRDLRALGVQVVRIETLPEKLSFDLKWFAVEAGKPVQIVLVNKDAMPHNLLIGKPGSLEEIGTKGGAMPMPTDPAVTRAFVPDSPLVLHATDLLKEGDTGRLGFKAPATPGEYPFVCTFPGHWVRMYGVMLVLEDIDAWEAKPTVPVDPMTGKPFTSARN
jgi:azurin